MDAASVARVADERRALAGETAHAPPSSVEPAGCLPDHAVGDRLSLSNVPPTQSGERGTCDDDDGEFVHEDRECLQALLRDVIAAQHSRCRRVAISPVPPWGFASECMRRGGCACAKGRVRVCGAGSRSQIGSQ